MKRYGWLVALGVLALLAFTVATLPASLVGGRVGRWGVEASSWTGTVWSGRAENLTVHERPLGIASWTVEPAGLLTGRLAGRAQLERADGRLEGRYSLHSGGRAQFDDLTIDLPVEALQSVSRNVLPGWGGRVQGHLDTLSIADGWPVAATGSLDFVDLVTPPPRAGDAGSYRLVFAEPVASGSPDVLRAELTDVGGPLVVSGDLQLGADRSFDLQGHVARRGTAATGFDRAISLLGPPDADGRRPFGVSGTF